jgi:hypothetical protein
MLDVTADNLWEEVRLAELFRDSHLDRVKTLIDYYTGSAYRGEAGGDWSENHMYEFLRINTAKVVFDNPRVRVGTRRPASQRQTAVGIQHGLNRLIVEANLRRLLKRVFAAQCFAFDVVQTVVEPQPWMDPRTGNTYHWPMNYQIDRDRFFFDPLCRWFGQARYSGHKFLRDKEDILAEAKADPSKGWMVENIKLLSEDGGVEDVKERQDVIRADIRRKEILGYEIWVPEKETGDASKGYNGTIYTIAVSAGDIDGNDAKTAYIREPRPYYGPRWGPYTLYGVYPVPGDPYPLAPFVANHRQMTELNDIVSATNTAIKLYKKIILVSAENPDLQNKVKDTPGHFVVAVKGFQKDQVVELESGGVTSQHVEQLQLALDRMDRNSGISETHRGNVGSRSTATEIAVADESSKGSIAYIQQEFTDATIQLLRSCAWFLYHDDRVKFPLGEEAAGELGMVEPWFNGGLTPEDSEYAFDDLELEIEPYSMERMSEALARAQYKEQVELALQAAPIIPAAPFYDWKKLFEKGGDVNNDPYFGEFFDPEIASMVGQLAAGGQPGQPGGASDGIGTGSPAMSKIGQMNGQNLAATQNM